MELEHEATEEVGNNNQTERLIFKGLPMARKNAVTTIERLPINKIKLNKNSRLNIDPDELDGLMQSIKEEGLLQPIGVVKNGSSYEICYGNRRFLACSKLGISKIPAIVHEKQKESDVDIKNLTENVQRRSISLMEVGRYITLLESQGLSKRESAVRLGVTPAYVDAALTAFQAVPKEFRGDIEVKVAASNKGAYERTSPGKISINIARKIISAEKSGKIGPSDARVLYKAAKESSKFNPTQIDNYISAVASGEKKFLEKAPDMVHVGIAFVVSRKEKESLQKRFVEDGPFNSFTALCLAVLRGEKSVKINAIRKGQA